MLPTNTRILCVDEKDCCQMLDFMLNISKPVFEFVGADSAEKALKLAENEKFDIYLLEYCLPEMSGIELCRRIRKTDADTPILFFSGMARPADRDEAMAAGATEYLIKPNDLDKFVETVERLLHKGLIVSKPVPAINNKVH